MRKTFSAFIVSASLLASWSYAFGEAPGAMDAEALLNLAPHISLEGKDISTFEVKGTLDFDGAQLRFIASGKKPDQLTLKLLDPRDETPIMVGVDSSVMFYDPISSEVLLGRAESVFTLRVEKGAEDSVETCPGQRLVISFGFRSIRDEEREGRRRRAVNHGYRHSFTYDCTDEIPRGQDKGEQRVCYRRGDKARR